MKPDVINLAISYLESMHPLPLCLCVVSGIQRLGFSLFEGNQDSYITSQNIDAEKFEDFVDKFITSGFIKKH